MNNAVKNTRKNYQSRYANFASWAESDPANLQNAEAARNYFLARLPQRPNNQYTIIDAGCGSGRDIQQLQTKLPNSRISGFDVCPGFVDLCKSRGLEVCESDFFTYFRQAPSSSVDGVFALASLFHVPRDHLLTVLVHIFRCLTRNGIIFATFSASGRNCDRSGSDGRWHNDMPLQDLNKVFTDAGFKIDCVLRLTGLYNGCWYGIVAKKV